MTAVLPQIAPPPELFAPPRFNPEFDLLLACCAGQKTQPASVNWQRFAELAQDHGVVPRVYQNLSGAAATDLFPLQGLYDLNLRKALLLTRELLRICTDFEARGIDVLPYKGPALACQLYGNVAARQFSDLDLLVRLADVQRAQAALQALGYTRSQQLSSRQEAAYLRSGYEYTFDGTLGRNVVELKWAVVPRFYSMALDVDRLFERAVPVEIAGRPLKTLNAEDALLVLCIHAAKHYWSELSWLCDLQRMLEVCDLDWRSIRDRAAHLGIGRILAITFLLANDLLRVDVPQMICADDEARRFAKGLLPGICSRDEHDPASLDYFRAMMRMRERWQDRMRFATRLASTAGPNDWDAIHLPDAMFAFYSGVRVIRIANGLFSGNLLAAKKLDSPEPPEAVLHPPG